MTWICKLTMDEVAAIVAEKFLVPEKKVHVKRYMETVGVGIGEHEEPWFHIEVEKDDED